MSLITGTDLEDADATGYAFIASTEEYFPRLDLYLTEGEQTLDVMVHDSSWQETTLPSDWNPTIILKSIYEDDYPYEWNDETGEIGDPVEW